LTADRCGSKVAIVAALEVAGDGARVKCQISPERVRFFRNGWEMVSDYPN
jgi:hypothetical protein